MFDDDDDDDDDDASHADLQHNMKNGYEPFPVLQSSFSWDVSSHVQGGPRIQL